MKRTTMLLGAGTLMFCSMVYAAVPQLINFQGVLRDGSGNPVANGSYSVVFTIYDAASLGNVKWQETQSVNTSNGLFSVLLGSSIPVLASLFNDSSRYLGVKIGTDPEMTPRQQLVSVAYSQRVAHFIPSFGLNNTFIGRNAGNLTMSGFGNTVSGVSALRFNTTGNDNTASGVAALGSNTTGGDNTASGALALLNNTTGNDNTASGRSSLQSNTTGFNNTASGASALQSNTTGTRNTASGWGALFSNTTGSSNTASGYRALFSNTTGFDNTASGNEALLGNTTGNYNTASGLGALVSNSTGSNNTAIGSFANVSAVNLNNATAIGNGATVNASNKIRLGNSAVTVIEGQVAHTFPSDKNQKENFRPVDGNEVLRKIRGFNLSSWNYKGHDPKQFRHYGPMAQEFFTAFGNDGVGKIGTETTLNSGDMAGILMVAVQALGNENADLKARVEYLEEMLKEMRAEKPQATTPDGK